MSGYDSISDWAFNKFNLNDYDDFQEFLSDLEDDFIENQRSPLNEIFDEKDYTRLEKEFYERKGEIDEEEEEEELEEKEKERITDLENEALEKFTLINERWEQDVKEIVKDLPKDSTKKLLTKFKNKVSGFIDRLRRGLSR